MINFSSFKVADKLVRMTFFERELKFQLYQSLNYDKFISALANFIARKPILFAKAEIVKALLQPTNSCHPESFKCISMIFNDTKSETAADELLLLGEMCNIAITLLSALMEAHDDENIKMNVVMALRSCGVNKKSFCQSSFPWRLLLKKIIDAAYTKTNEILQLNCIQLLRIMSDAQFMKDEMRKVYKRKLREMHCLNEQNAAMMEDLLEWLDYKNYKQNDGKYAKLFI